MRSPARRLCPRRSHSCMSRRGPRGKVVVLNFIYTNCPDICPLHSEPIAELQRMINPTPRREAVQFNSVTADPAHDTWSVMKGCGPAHGLDPANGMFLTSGPDRPEVTIDPAPGLRVDLRARGQRLSNTWLGNFFDR